MKSWKGSKMTARKANETPESFNRKRKEQSMKG